MKKKLSAFTLTEILIVIIMVGVLLTTLIYSFRNMQERTRDLDRAVDINEVAGAVELLLRDTGALLTSGRVVCLNSTTVTSLVGRPNKPLYAYLDEVPFDPNVGNVNHAFAVADAPGCNVGEYAILVSAGGTSARVIAVGESLAGSTFTRAWSDEQLTDNAITESELSTGSTVGLGNVLVIASRVVTD